MVRKRDLTGGSDEQKAADDHRRCFADPPGQAWLRSISQAPTRPPNSRDGAGHDARESRRGMIVHANRTLMEKGRQFFRKTNHKIWTVSDLWIIYVARSTVC